MAEIALWNGDIGDLEVDATVSPASTSPRLATGIARAIARRGPGATGLQGPGTSEAIAIAGGARVTGEVARAGQVGAPRASRETYALRGAPPSLAFRSAPPAQLALPARTLS